LATGLSHAKAGGSAASSLLSGCLLRRFAAMNADTLNIMPLMWWFAAVLVFLVMYKMR
jgi:hypothetical protein